MVASSHFEAQMNPNIELLKVEFREFCVVHLTLRWIDDVFSTAGFEAVELDSYPSGERRSLVMQYYASAEWKSIETVRQFLKVLENTLLLSFLTGEAKESLRSLCNGTGFEVDSNGYTVHLTTKGVGQQVKNLIFAADGPKPEIILSDSVSNDIEIVKNAEYCLVYDRPIQTHGLLWSELVGWWRDITNDQQASDYEVGEKLYRRLEKSLASQPERFLWRIYFKCFYHGLGERFPALIPQVYLHYDPYTIKQLEGERRLIRQRMDFLLLLSDRVRVVIEVDGKHHYAVGEKAEPRLYSEMVGEDRKLKLAGYEVFRFGGYELQTEDAEHTVEEFFLRLFEWHEIGQDAT
jgi:very-short-patch-repair endonuclease